MSSKMPKCKITVLKRTVNQDLIDEFLENPQSHPGLCEYLSEGQEFIVDQIWSPPDGFCAWAWADVRGALMTVVSGGKFPGMKQSGTMITGCSDWLRPVLFKVELIS